MKLKKLLCLMLVAIFVFATLNVSAAKEEIEIISNGGFDELGGTFWDPAGTNCLVSNEVARSGRQSFKCSADTTEGTGAIAFSTHNGFVGATYTFSAWVYAGKKLTPESHPEINLIFQDDVGAYLDRSDAEIKDCQEGKWYQISATGTAPSGTTQIRVYFRMRQGGTFFWDDVSLKVTGDKKTMEAYRELVEREKRLAAEQEEYFEQDRRKIAATEIAEGSVDLVFNGGFEDGTGNSASYWAGYQGKWGEIITRTTEEKRSGEYGIEIDTRGSDLAQFGPHSSQILTINEGFIPGMKYVFTAWAKQKSHTYGTGAFLKVETYNSTESAYATLTGEFTTEYYNWDDTDPEGNEWHPMKLVFEIPEDTKKLVMYVRMRGEGLVYYDDLSFGIADGGDKFEMYSTRTFCYTEDEIGTAVAKINTTAYPVEPNATFEFAIKDGDNILESGSVPAAQESRWNFNINSMEKELYAYTLEAVYKDASGNQIGDVQSQRIYRTHRPGCINENGNYIDENGEIFYPIFGYGDADDFWQDSEVHGINVFKTMVWGHDFDIKEEGLKKYKKMLDDGQKEGIKFFLQLGALEPNGYPGASNDMAEFLLKNVGNHPAIFAWIVIDEATLKIGMSDKIANYDHMQKYLEESYIQIRKYDTMHPVYILDVENRGNMEKTSRIADVIATDPYPHSQAEVPDYTYSRARWLKTADNNDTPINIVSVMTPFSVGGWRPSITEIRNQFYQGFWGGAKMVGVFSMTGSHDMVLESLKDIPERYQQWCDIISSGEKEIIFKHFTTPDTVLIANWQEKDVWYRIWQDPDDGQMYLAVMNVTTGEMNTDIKLISNNGKISFDGYTATLVNGTDLAKTVTSADNKFNLKMPALGVGLYKLNPANSVDITALDDNMYADMAGFDWAKTEIETLAMKDVINEIAGGFAPGENITRADFAGFLIRTLGLTADSTDTFDDIDPNHYYAKEIATGKALGVLNGVGNNCYNPDAAITRQDVMTICARGMEIAKMMDTKGTLVRLDSFTDKDLFADYAALHASKMVIEGIVKGNPDQTINPLGNTTRAEAAVMMYRIMYKGHVKTKA